MQARRFYTRAENGLSQLWEGRVFVNLPFGVVAGRSLSGAFSGRILARPCSGGVAYPQGSGRLCLVSDGVAVAPRLAAYKDFLFAWTRCMHAEPAWQH